jgi:hypothetical protein
VLSKKEQMLKLMRDPEFTRRVQYEHEDFITPVLEAFKKAIEDSKKEQLRNLWIENPKGN